MNQNRAKLFNSQLRAFNEGTVEFLNGQWVFFDEETEDAHLLDEWIGVEAQWFDGRKWRTGIVQEDGVLNLQSTLISLSSEEKVRIRKPLIHSLDHLLDDIHEDAFIQFLTTLNSLGFSLYDCIYCHNHLSFLSSQRSPHGVNMLIFDNGEQICGVQHHFGYFRKMTDRFEFTCTTGKRLVIERIS
ncbi:DUF2777 family protein [Bacillus fonticola]|uniref:DUF2777 family protein n=1 Tax=Bacillus fonticola TaxID=2728853 RepID=UPI001473EEE6|nr:DUF2777 family protein [Bacillus fonticola]